MATAVSSNISASPTREWQRFPDIARILAIIAVVTIHVTAPVNEGLGQESYGVWLASTLIESASRWSVPVFVMLSGMLLLNDSTTAPADFYRRRASRVLVPALFWTVFYLGFRVWFIHETLSPQQIWQSVATGQPYYHLYFIFIIIGLYFVAPYLARAIRDLNQVQLAALAAGALLFAVLGFGLSPWMPVSSVTAVTQWVPYVGYLLAGLLLGRIRITRRLTVVATAGFVLSVAATALGTALLVSATNLQQGRVLYGYLSPTVILMSLSAFVLLRRVFGSAHGMRGRTLHSISTATFGVFLVHPIFFEWWIRTPLGGVPHTAAALKIWLPVTILGVVLSAFLVALGMARIPVLKRLI